MASTPPATKRIIVRERIHGQVITDPYRWLEGNDTSVKKWVKKQNMFTDQVLQRHTDRISVQRELIKYLKIDWIGTPIPIDGQFFWRERRKSQNQPVLCYKKNYIGKEKLLFDPNLLDKKGTTTIDFWTPSPRGTYVALGVSRGGTEHSVVHIIETNTRKFLKEKISFTRYSDIGWLPDESGFFYTRHPKQGTVPKGDEWYYPKIYFHKLGERSEKDTLIFGEGLARENMIDFSISSDGYYLCITTTSGYLTNDVYIYNIKLKHVTRVVHNKNAKFIPSMHRGVLYLLTNYKASHFKIIATNIEDIPKHINLWKTIVRESNNIIDHILPVSNFLIVSSLEHASSRLAMYDLRGNKIRHIPLPTFGTIGIPTAEAEGNEVFISFESFVFPAVIYRITLSSRRISTYEKVKHNIKTNTFSVSQVWFKSHDKTKVPMFLIHKKGVRKNSNLPVLLYGYGGFSINMTPSLLKNYIPFLEKGGMIALPNIRGGGELGESWHKDGMLHKKQHTFDDFISAAAALIKLGYTNTRRLAIMGGSNGGLLVGACMTQRPDLFKAVVCRVPLLDMIRFPKFLIAAYWISEYGNPEKKYDFKYIRAWSPYHNVKNKTEYPAVLFTTANKDSRVDPLHARKMAALLQFSNRINPVMLRTDFEAGHGIGKSFAKAVNEQTDILAFLYWQLGIT